MLPGYRGTPRHESRKRIAELEAQRDQWKRRCQQVEAQRDAALNELARQRARAAVKQEAKAYSSTTVTPTPPGIMMPEDPCADDGEGSWDEDDDYDQDEDNDDDEPVPQRGVPTGPRVPKLLEVATTGEMIIEEGGRYRPPPGKSRHAKVEGYLRTRDTGVEEVTIQGLKIRKDDLLRLSDASTIPPKLRFEYEDGMTLTLGDGGREMLRRCIRLKGRSGDEQGTRVCELKNEELLRLAYRCGLWDLVQRLHLEHMRRLPFSPVHKQVRDRLSRQAGSKKMAKAKAAASTPRGKQTGDQVLMARDAHHYRMAQIFAAPVHGADVQTEGDASGAHGCGGAAATVGGASSLSSSCRFIDELDETLMMGCVEEGGQ